ncbi:MAG: response regulator transcription factor [bacterium]|nr:response regulator transcription factor [bacterium]MBU1917994.1 response regulator transcription factor [bacterium]
MQEQKRVFIVDDHPIVRHGLKKIFEQEADLTVCGEAEDVATALKEIQEKAPDLIVVDLSLKNSNGLDIIKAVKTTNDIPIIVLSIHDETIYAERVLRAGAKGYVMKQEAADQLIIAIRKVMTGEIFVSDKMGKYLLQKYIDGGAMADFVSPISKLSDREIEIYRLIGEGRSTRQIAEDLALSIKTVESHRAHIKQKLRLKSGTELVHNAVQWVQSEKSTS